MKRCSECNRIEAKVTLNFCRLDGTQLIHDLASLSESATMPLPAATPIEELSTRNLHKVASIAVLPFVDISADHENEYFCDGLAEELLNALAKIDGLKVTARSSAFSFKGKNVEGLNRSAEYFKQALELDADYSHTHKLCRAIIGKRSIY